jgi:2-polyprenyl-6-methoxyphenol hydroxylase-like FAD-dependent oxidoreductase
MAPFKVIIVGGSIAGLTLANIFERYEIDYIVLEKYEEIAPQLGAGFAILPNGGHLLDQLGCYEALAKINEPVNSMEFFDEHGARLGSLSDMETWMKDTYVDD